MIAKLKSNRSLASTIDYNVREHSELIGSFNLAGETIMEFQREIKMTQSLFDGRAKNLTAHIILSPSVEDGNNLSNEEWLNLAKLYLAKTKFDTRQSIVFLHKDKEHKHLHVVTNRINQEGNIYRNGAELFLSQRVGDEIAKEYGFKRAKVLRDNNRLKKSPTEIPEGGGTFNRIKRDMLTAANEVIFYNKHFVADYYFRQLNSLGYQVKTFTAKNASDITGYALGKDADYYNSSAFGREFTLGSLQKMVLSNETISFYENQQKGFNPLESKYPIAEIIVDDQTSEQRVQPKVSELGRLIKEICESLITFDHIVFFQKVRKAGYRVKQIVSVTGKFPDYIFMKGASATTGTQVEEEIKIGFLERIVESIKAFVNSGRKLVTSKSPSVTVDRREENNERYHRPTELNDHVIEVTEKVQLPQDVAPEKVLRLQPSSAAGPELQFDDQVILKIEHVAKQKFDNAKNYLLALELAGLTVERFHNSSTGELRGYSILIQGSFKNASELGKKYTLGHLLKNGTIKLSNGVKMGGTKL